MPQKISPTKNQAKHQENTTIETHPNQHQALYRKYRPQFFHEVVGQEHVVSALCGSLKTGNVSHGHIFTGPRGTGKTTLARLYAKALNCQNRTDVEPCGSCAQCVSLKNNSSLSIIEIDAASYTQVEYIRQLRDEAIMPAVGATYKIYIIDEVHMLSKSSFNALLKILEEPPQHVIFLFATTEIHNVPETILSRVERHDLQPLSMEELIQKLERINIDENLQLDTDALEAVALSARGALRDAESLLAKVRSISQDTSHKVTGEEVRKLLGLSPFATLHSIADALIRNSGHDALSLLEQTIQKGYSATVLGRELLEYFRKLLLLGTDARLQKHVHASLNKEQLEQLTHQATQTTPLWTLKTIDTISESLNSPAGSVVPQLPLEMAFVTIMQSSSYPQKKTETDTSQNTKNKQNERTKPVISTPPDIQKADKHTTPEPPANPTKIITSKNADGNTSLTIEILQKHWGSLIKELRASNQSLSVCASHCVPTSYKDNTLQLSARFSIYADKINTEKVRLTIQETLSTIVGRHVDITCVTDTKSTSSPIGITRNSSSSPLVDEAMRVFGSPRQAST